VLKEDMLAIAGFIIDSRQACYQVPNPKPKAFEIESKISKVTSSSQLVRADEFHSQTCVYD
jgi:hypothetical protein